MADFLTSGATTRATRYVDMGGDSWKRMSTSLPSVDDDDVSVSDPVVDTVVVVVAESSTGMFERAV